MSVVVPADLEAVIRQKVESSLYEDPAEVIQAAVRLLDKRDQQLEKLRALVAEGLATLERGEGKELTPELWEEIERAADEQIRLGIPPDPDVCP
jgi:putative addiction module CopG family antidote